MNEPASGENVRRFIVSGRVQGVGFRWFVRELGRAENLRGIARNLADGSVEVIAAGPPDSLRRLEARLGEGPPHAKVDKVLSQDPDERDEYSLMEGLPSSFEIER